LMMAGYKLLSETDKADATSQMKNYQFMNSLPPKDREAFQAMLTSNSGSLPAAVQEYNFYNQLDAAGKAEFLRVKRADMPINLGGTQAVRSPAGGIIERYAVTPRPEDQPGFKAAQAAATTQATEGTKRQIEAESALPQIRESAATARNLVNQILNHEAFGSSVGWTWKPGAKYIPGSPEAGFAALMGQLQGKAFLEAFETLKGGGQITEVEGNKATQAINRMNTSTSEKDFRKAAQDFLDVVGQAERRAVSKVVKSGDEPQQKKASGSYQDPYTVTDDASYNSVPKGKYYKAPDNSIRQRK